MYQPPQFRLDSRAECHRVIEVAPFATLVTHDASGELSADHLPLLLAPAGDASSSDTLIGHIARANPLVRELESPLDGIEALAIFHGPQAYITPSWYPAKQEHGKVVPTWNYQVVHVHGRLRLIDDPHWLREMVTTLTERFESERERPWQVEDAPDDYIAAMCRAIVGIEITAERLEGKRKASQHKPLDERRAIHQGLQDEYGYGEHYAACLSGIMLDET
ncbi:FMN-binding negative transcriptional regulator [Chromohalobacter canadensis]|uniref:FMN-binding negative transcriptional regulator n=1 Tax=Chromohalobacter canadensis TaxID=141389 RepID=A0ABZ0Y8S2_9GAMM|nr:FMN-binding negative transcriptional regulator [Chromohalobacter canadensis]MCK0767891.1 FMN-binding negative transcriptional regulator [Chromohalobacter canadensis]WQH08461.1 FMN-binding negative transcriptional regulator [Chromohalobacter canadensis]